MKMIVLLLHYKEHLEIEKDTGGIPVVTIKVVVIVEALIEVLLM
jgi:hypothetical protein